MAIAAGGIDGNRPSGMLTPELRTRWGWLLAFGIMQVVAGFAAILVPVVASLVAVGLFGAILLVSAVFHLLHALQVRKWPGFALHLAGGLLYGAAGTIVLLDPLNGVTTLMLVIGVLFIVDGAVRTTLAFQLRPRDGWGWFLAAGLTSAVLGVLLLAMWPGSALWLVGTLFGINLFLSGIMETALALQCRRSSIDSASPGHAAPA